LSLAAYLRHQRKSLRIFGAPMRFWEDHMPQGMRLKSEGFASSLYEPEGKFTLGAYCSEKNLPYADIGLPVPIETFIAYGLEFQRRYVPELENAQIASVAVDADGFRLRTEAGEQFCSRRVVVATGILNFAYLPPEIAGLPPSLVTHSSVHGDLNKFKGSNVAVLGAGASALDIAALLHQAGAKVRVVARRASIAFHDPPQLNRSLLEGLKAPRSGLGTGWRSRLCVDLPLVFHSLPESMRLRATARHLGPAPCWFIRDTVERHVAMHVGAKIEQVESTDSSVRLSLRLKNDERETIEVNHVIAATGYKTAVSKLPFLDAAIRSDIRKVVDSPILDRNFGTSVRGLYFIGAAAANSFGPLLRFAFGASFSANRMARHLA
jgi:thioredoxin reductase